MSITAAAYIAAIGVSTLGGMITGASKAKQSEKDRKQRNREFIESMALSNKQLDVQQENFRQNKKFAEQNRADQAPNRLLDTIGKIRSLGQRPSTSADKLKYLTQ